MTIARLQHYAPTPVIDIFAGPGGLGEGFASLRSSGDTPAYDIRLSVEKDPVAHRTLELRSFFRAFQGDAPDDYYAVFKAGDSKVSHRLERLFEKHPRQAERARSEAWNAELGLATNDTTHQRISQALGKADSPWILLGGPPCQAYSLAGRSRNMGEPKYRPEEDARQFLYIEYLQILAEHRPSVFILENVKGLLSATLNKERIFNRILEDLRSPVEALRREGRPLHRVGSPSSSCRYRILSLVERDCDDESDMGLYVIRMEQFGIPQARHRIIVLGIREDIPAPGLSLLSPHESQVPVHKVLDRLPRLRSGISDAADDADTWCGLLRDVPDRRWCRSLRSNGSEDVYRRLLTAVREVAPPRRDRGAEFIEYGAEIDYRPDWYLDRRLHGIVNHATRSHIRKDLYRYFYSACFAKARGSAPLLRDFPKDLVPNHENAKGSRERGPFADRFRVQVHGLPATTITSHISRDGHYYIHPDATQCRSLTVREAARIQTFPDNYFFCGPRTAQYVQVGNAVPPLLAQQIARSIAGILT